VLCFVPPILADLGFTNAVQLLVEKFLEGLRWEVNQAHLKQLPLITLCRSPINISAPSGKLVEDLLTHVQRSDLHCLDVIHIVGLG
jgi:hypothetical protein